MLAFCHRVDLGLLLQLAPRADDVLSRGATDKRRPFTARNHKIGRGNMAPRCLAARVALLVCLCSPGLAQQDCWDRAICKALVKKYSCTDTAAKMGIRNGKIAKPSDELRDICCKSCQAKSSGAGSQDKDKDMCKDQSEHCDLLKGQPCNKDTSAFRKGTTLQQLCPRLCPDYDCGKKKGKERTPTF